MFLFPFFNNQPTTIFFNHNKNQSQRPDFDEQGHSHNNKLHSKVVAVPEATKAKEARTSVEDVGIASSCYNERNPIFIRRGWERLTPTSNKHQDIPRDRENITIVNKTLQRNKSWGEDDDDDGRGGGERHNDDGNNRGNKQKTNQITSHFRNLNGIGSEQFIAKRNHNRFRNSMEAVASPVEGLVSLTTQAASRTTPNKQAEDKFLTINNNRTRKKQGRGWESEDRINSGYDAFHSNVPNVLARFVC